VLEADVEVDRRAFTVCAVLAVAPGERLALFGPSGAGKTTMLEVVAGLVVPRRARIVLAGRVLTDTEPPAVAVPPWRRRVGLLRQDPGLFPHLSVRENLRYSGGVERGELESLAAALGIDGLLGSMPAKLSGGQSHRVALGRLLLSHCETLLLDEPYTGLDASLRRSLTELVIGLVADRGIPAILVAHELAEAQAFADRLAILDQGSLLQVGGPDEVVRRPASRRVAELVGYTAFWSGADGLVYGVHPDRVISGSHPDLGLVISGVVSACRPAGALWEVSLRTAGVTVTGRVLEPVPVDQEMTVTVTDPPGFRPDGLAVACDQAEVPR
jgi:molybdate transport system ATP-binding protein